MELVDVTDSKSVGSDTVWVRVPPPAPSEAGSLFELFYRKTAPLHSVSIEMTRFSTSLAEDVLLKSRKKFYKKYTQVRILDTEFLINPVSHLFRTAPQTLPEPYTPRSDGGGYGCKS